MATPSFVLEDYAHLFQLFPWKSCITLRHTPWRTDEARREFAMYGVNDITYFFADKSFNPIEGCFMSHYNVMKQALMDNAPHALVFEDDVKFNDKLTSLSSIVDEVERFLESTDFDILYLGWCAGYGSYFSDCIMKSTKLPNYNFIYTSHCACTHAVVYSRRFMNMFVSNYKFYSDEEFQGHIDQVFLRIPNIKMFQIVPTLFDQKWCFSVMDYGKFKCVDEQKFSKEKFANHFLVYKKHSKIVMASFLLAILIVVAILLFLMKK